MAQTKFKVLTPAEIKQLNREGFDLNEEKFFALSFLVNTKQNHAADPVPFRIAPEFLEELTKTGMGRPWLPDTLPNGKHIRPKKNATAEEILQFQKDFAGGVMRGYWVNPLNQNANVIIEIFPEFIKDVESGNIKPFVSLMVGNWKENDKGEIIAGEVLHLQSVDSPGYDKEIAKFLGTCEGNFNECALELEPLAAMGKLKDYRNSSISCPKKFLNTLGAEGTSMPEETSTTETTTETPKKEETNGTSEGESKIIEKLEGIETKVESIETKVETVEKSQETVKEAVMEVAVAANGVDEEKIKEKLGMGAAEHPDTDNPKPKDKEEPVAAGGNQKLLAEVKQTKKELAEMKKERDAEKKVAADNERKRQVEIIIKSKLLTKEITLEDKDKITKDWMEKKSSSNPEELADLSLVAEEAEKKINSILPEEDPIAAYGGDYVIPDSEEVNYTEIEKRFS